MPRTIALVYLAAGALWIFLTDRWLAWLDLDPDTLAILHTCKGWLAILGSAILLYILLRRPSDAMTPPSPRCSNLSTKSSR